MLFGLIPTKKKDRKGKGVDPAERPNQPQPQSARRVASEGGASMLAPDRDRDRRASKSHTAGDLDRRRSIFGRLYDAAHAAHTPTHHADPSSSTGAGTGAGAGAGAYAGHPAYAEPSSSAPAPVSGPRSASGPFRASAGTAVLLAPPPRRKKKQMTSLKEAAKAMPALREESEPRSSGEPGEELGGRKGEKKKKEEEKGGTKGERAPRHSMPLSPRGLMDLAEILAEIPYDANVNAGSGTAELQAAHEPAAPAHGDAPNRAEPATPPATPLYQAEPRRAVATLPPVLEMDHALALSRIFTGSPPASPSPASAPAPTSTSPTPPRAEPATPRAPPPPPPTPVTSIPTPVPRTPGPPPPPPPTPTTGAPIERDFAYLPRLPSPNPDRDRDRQDRQEKGERQDRAEPPTPPATPLSPTLAGRARHASQLATVLEVEGRLSALDLVELLGDEGEGEEGKDANEGEERDGEGQGAESRDRAEPATPPATPASPPPRGGSRGWRMSTVIPPVFEWGGEIERAIAAAVGEPEQAGRVDAGGAEVRESKGEAGGANGTAEAGAKAGGGESPRKPVTLLPADEGHVATAMAESIQTESAHDEVARVVEVVQAISAPATMVLLGPVPARTPSPRERQSGAGDTHAQEGREGKSSEKRSERSDGYGETAPGHFDAPGNAPDTPENRAKIATTNGTGNGTAAPSPSGPRSRTPSNVNALGDRNGSSCDIAPGNPAPKAAAAAAVVSDPEQQGWRVPRVRSPPGSRRRSRMFGFG